MRPGALVLLGTILVAGCGTVPPSLVNLRRQAGHICSRTNHAVDRIPVPRSPAQAEAYLRAGSARLGTELGQLRRLTPSSDVAAVYRIALNAFAGQAAALRSAADAIHRGEDPALAFKRLQQQLGPLQTQADHAWQALEIPACFER